MRSRLLLLFWALCLVVGCQGTQATPRTPTRLGAGPPSYGPTTVALAQAVALATDHGPIVVSGTTGQATSASTDPGQNLSLADTNAHAFGTSAAASIDVIVAAPLGNTATVYCALGSGVTSGNTGKGIPLEPGDRERFRAANANLIYCITGTATQNVHAVAE